MTTEHDVRLTDTLVRVALTQDPPDGTAEIVWHDLGSAISSTRQQHPALIRWPWTPAFPGVGAGHRTRRLQQMAMLVTLAILVASTVVAISIIGSLRRVPPPTGLARPGLIAFDAGGDVFVADSDGGGLTRLTSGPAWDVQPTWSQDGTRIAYQSLLAGDTETRLIVMDADGSNATTIANWSYDGHPTDRYGNAVPGGAYGFRWFRASWAPDGHAIALGRLLDGRPQIVIVQVDGSGSAILGDRTLEGQDPIWSPDGSRIAFRGGRYDDERGIYVMDADGSDIDRLTTWRRDSDSRYLEPTWSPDSRRMTYDIHLSENSSVDGDWSSWQVWVVDAQDGTRHPITDAVAENDHGVWSPDGGRVAYMRRIAGEVPRFVVTDPDGSNTVILPPAVSGAPTWSPDSRKLTGHVYGENAADLRSLAIVDVATGSVRIVDPPAPGPGPDGTNEALGDASWQRLAN
jgi:hypothetical protein